MAAVILDTGPIVALIDRREALHDWARSAFARLRFPLQTRQAVITETCFPLRSQPVALGNLRRHLEAGHFVDALDFPALTQRIMALTEQYASVPISFADACLVAISETAGTVPICTLDRDFLIYRRADRTPPGLVAPFVE